MKRSQGEVTADMLTVGTIFGTDHEHGCIVTSAPDPSGTFEGLDTDGELCTFTVQQVTWAMIAERLSQSTIFDRPMDRVERYIRAASAMEYRLGDVYVQIRSALFGLNGENDPITRSRLTAALVSIERTSSRLLEIAAPEDAIKWDYIHRTIIEIR